MEDWAIWQRFQREYRAGRVKWGGTEDEWGALPEDQPRQRELRLVLERALVIDPQRRVVARAEFRAREPVPQDLPPGVMRPLEVRWTPVE